MFFTKIEESAQEGKTASFSKTLGLLNNSNILLSFLGILCVVGLDVGMNTVTPKLLIERVGLAKEAATYGASWYFAARTIGTVFGIFLLAKFSEKSFFKINMMVVGLALVGLLFVQEQMVILALVSVVAFASSSIFAVIYTLAIKSQPSLTNEISGLMITGVAGGAIVPPLMGFATDALGSQQGSLVILLLCSAYLLFCSFKLNSSS